MRRALFAAVGVVLTCAASSFAATAPNDLPQMRLRPPDANAARVDALAGMVIQKTPPYPKANYVNVDAVTSRGYCFVSGEYALRLSKVVTSNEEGTELWRVWESDGKVRLER